MGRYSLLLLFLGLASFVFAESIFQFPDLPRRLPLRPTSQGCAHKGVRYQQGERVPTDEACLNCTCTRAVLVCYLRVCPTSSPPPPGCFPAREPGECCPTLICGGLLLAKPDNKPYSSPDPRPTFMEETTVRDLTSTIDFQKDSSPMITIETPFNANTPLEDIDNFTATYFNGIHQKPYETTVPLEDKQTVAPTTEGTSNENVDIFTFTTTHPPSTVSKTAFHSTLTADDSLVYITSTEDPLGDDINFFNDIPGGCMVNGTLYGDGSAMLSSTLCEHCFCIRGKTTCMKPKCHITIDGCTAHYDSHSCCPSKYDCSERISMFGGNGSVSETFSTTPTLPKTTKYSGNPRDCTVDGKIYHQGEVVHDRKQCHNCFCSDSSVICEKIKCSPPIAGCQPIIPDGHCCPVSYRCDYQPGHNENNKIKGSNVNDSSTSTVNKGTDIKTVKNYYIPNNDDSHLKTSNDKEFIGSLHKIIPSLRRFSNNTFHARNSTIDDITAIRIGQGVSKSTNGGIQVTPDIVRENDKSLYIDLPTTVSQPGTFSSETVLVGSPVMHTLSGNAHQLFDQFFSRQHVTVSKVPSEMSFGPQRSNSKQPVRIVNIYDSKTEAPDSTTAVSNVELVTTPMFNKNNAAETTILTSTYEEPTKINTSTTMHAKDSTYETKHVQIPTVRYQDEMEATSSVLNTESTYPVFTTTVRSDDFTEQLKKDLISNDAVTTFASIEGLTEQDFSTTTLSDLLKIASAVYQDESSPEDEALSTSSDPSTGFIYSETPKQTYTTRLDYTTTKHTLMEDLNLKKTTKPIMLIYGNTKKIPATATEDSETRRTTSMFDTRNPFGGNSETLTESATLKGITNHGTDTVTPSHSIMYTSTQNNGKFTKTHSIPSTPSVYTTDRNMNTEVQTESTALISNDYKNQNAQSDNPLQSVLNTSTIPQQSNNFKFKFVIHNSHPGYTTTRNLTADVETKSTTLYVNDNMNQNTQSKKDIEWRPMSSTYINTENTDEKYSTQTESQPSFTTLKDIDIKGSNKQTDIQETSPTLSSIGYQNFFEAQNYTEDPAEESLLTASSTNHYSHQTLPPFIPTKQEEQMSNEKHITTVSDIIFGASSQKDSLTTKKSKLSTRINSKLPSFNNALKTNIKTDGPVHLRDPITHSDVNLYLPIEGREIVDDEEDFLRTVYLGAPLSVGGTYNEKDIEKPKITQSGGVIFMDPTYADLNSSSYLDSKEKGKNYTGIENPIYDVKDSVNNERKKAPRIQDAQNQSSTGQAFKIIPFVAEDAVRGQFGKLNNTLIVQQGSTEVPDIVSDFCFIKGRIYTNGEVIGKPDPCELCRCFYGRELCHRQSCPTPPDCIAERVPGFCCPRFTCGNNASSNEQIHKEIKPTSFVQVPEIRTSTTRKPDFIERIPPTTDRQEVKYGIRVRARPTHYPPVRSTEYTTEKKILRERSTIKPEIQTVPHKAFPPPPPPPAATSTISTSTTTTTTTTTKKPNVMQPTASIKPEIKTTTTTTTQSPFFPDPWGLFKVSGCNIYGKFYKINEDVEILSAVCSHCVCTTNGVECNDICKS